MQTRIKRLSSKLGVLEQRFFAHNAIDNALSKLGTPGWCGEGCRGECKGGGFFD